MKKITLSRKPEMQGGSICIDGTRMTVRTVAAYYIAGFTREEIQKDFPSTKPEDIDLLCDLVDTVLEARNTGAIA